MSDDPQASETMPQVPLPGTGQGLHFGPELKSTPGSGAHAALIADRSLLWALQVGWFHKSDLAPLRRTYADLDAIDDVPRALREAGLISANQRRELTEVAVLEKELPQYEIRKRLGSGAIGGVYLALSRETGDKVAIKVLHDEIAEQPDQRARFEREVSTLNKLDHDCIPRLHHYDCDARVPYLVMDFVAGITLAELVAEAGALPETYVLWAAGQLARALDYAYRRGGGLIHRDIKPDNVIVQLPEGMTAETLFTSRYPLKVVDFGLARAQDEVTSLTMTGMVMGTPRYMAPEQVMGRELDWRSDLYALGTTMYHLLTGRPPFTGHSPADVMMAHLQSPIPDPRRVVPAISPRTAAIVQRAMAKERGDRFPRYAHFIDECELCLRAVDDRPVVLLRKPFVLDQERQTPPRRRAGASSSEAGVPPAPGPASDHAASTGAAPRGDDRGGSPGSASRTAAVRQRVTRRYHSSRRGPQEGVSAAHAGSAPAIAQDPFADLPGRTVEKEGGATRALRRLLEARARGEASDLDLADLDEETDWVRAQTERLISIGQRHQDRRARLPIILLIAALLLLLMVAVVRFGSF